MKGIKYLLLSFILGMSQPALAAAPVFGTDAETSYTRQFRPPPGKAIVYIYQREQDGQGVSPRIWLNNTEIGRLVPGSFTIWQFSPGQINVRVDGSEPARLTVSAEAGNIYLFRLSVTKTDAGIMPRLQSMPPSYRGDLAATRLIKNPRELTEVSESPRPAVPPARPAPKPVEDKPAPPPKPEEKTVRAEPKPARETKPVLTNEGYSLWLKTGALSLSEDRQTILGATQAFDDSASGVLAIEVVYRLSSDVSVSGELLSYSADFTTMGSGLQNEVDVLVILANARQYFRTDSNVQPFIGAGIGVATTDTSGSIVGSTSGLAYQLLAGVEYRQAGFGVFAEYRYLSADTESSNSEKIDVSASGIFAGLAIYF